MPTVDFLLGRQKHTIACEEGEEPRIRQLAEAVHNRMSGVAKGLPGAGDTLALALTAIMMEDELEGLRRAPLDRASISAAAAFQHNQDAIDLAVATTLETIAERIESLANTLEKR